LTNVQKPPTEVNFYDEHGKAQKLVTLKDYSWHSIQNV